MVRRRDILNVNFHGIGDPTRPLDEGEARYWITRDVCLSVLDSLVGKANVRVSFDDGNESDYAIGLPALLERGLTATFFVLAGRLDKPGSLSRAQVVDLQAKGMRIGSHGMDHRPWVGLSIPDQRREFIEAREILSHVTGREIDEAALPLGRYDRDLLGNLRHLDYRRVYTSDWRWAKEGTWLQPRFSLLATHTAESYWIDALARHSGLRKAKQEVVGLAKRWR